MIVARKEVKDIKVNEKYIRWFSSLGKDDVSEVGGKAANLGEMYNLGLPVPQGFAILATAYNYFLEETGIKEKIYGILNSIDIQDTKELDDATKEIRELVTGGEMPLDLQKEIIDSYENLSVDKKTLEKASYNVLSILRMQEPAFVAVRSSATAEDSAEASFAGQQETFLNVKGKDRLIANVKKCFASLFTSRSVYYRVKNKFKHENVLIAVVVQEMINSDKSGVIFTKDPINDTGNVVVEAVFGLGEGIVSGRIEPDHYIVSSDLKIIEKRTAEKKIALVRDSSGNNGIVKLMDDRAKQQVLNDYEIKKLADYGLRLEEHYKKPQDIEFAISSNEIFIVQTRPITTLGKKMEEKQEVRGKEILSGQSASPGVGSGEVKIVRKLEDLQRIGKGDVLVTEMTNPDMVVSMQKAAAIVTDEGGMTCFSGDTKILTNKGFMLIKDAHELIKDNRELILLAYDSREMKPKWKKIISSGKRKSKTIRVSCSQKGKIEDNFIDLTEDHKMIIFGDRNLIKKPISEIINDEQMICLIDTLPKVGEFNNYKKAYLLGALLSDGYFKVVMHHTGNPRRGIVTFTQKETLGKKEFIETVKTYYAEIFGEKFKEIPFCSNSNLRGRQISGSATHFSSYKLAPALEISKISQNLDMWALNLDEKSSINLLAGLIDGDGCFLNNRLHIYVSKENILQGVILSCLNLGIFPQITRNRNIYHVQILERMSDILAFTKRVKGTVSEKILGNKLFSARQILGDIVDKVNLKGQIKPYVDNNLLIDSRKLERVFHLCSKEIKVELAKIISSGLRMQRIFKQSDLYEEDVFNLEIEADNELDHNFVVFTKKYTPLLVSNSHASIVSREMGIPCVVGTKTATKKLYDGLLVTVNGFNGKIYEGIIEKLKSQEVEIKQIAKTKTRIKVIVDLPDFAGRAAKTGCKQVGLTRLEGIIAESGKHPFYFVKNKEISKYEEIIYTGVNRIAEHFDELWIRTSDIRSDEFKNLQGSSQHLELNPMLGMHGIRFSLKHKDILKAELKALSRVADNHKKIGVMMPQVISVSELIEVKNAIKELGIENLKLGVMIETPAAVQIIEHLCKEGISFISFGTNDLTQYTLAVDRGNEQVQYLYDEMHPSVLSQLEKVISVCNKFGVETSICGQAASSEKMVEFLVKAGIDSLSVNADKAYDISEFVRNLEEKGFGKENKVEKIEEREERREEKKGFIVNCNECKKETHVPFKPDGIRPVYCKVCLEKKRQEKLLKKTGEKKENIVEKAIEKVAEEIKELTGIKEEKKIEEVREEQKVEEKKQESFYEATAEEIIEASDEELDIF